VVEKVLGGWLRTAAAGLVLLALFLSILVLLRAPDLLQYSSFPGHPYPPMGFTRNPFSSDPHDLISAAEATRVRTDLLADGQVELEAFGRGDKSLLTRADTGDRLALLQRLIDENTAAGIVQQEQDSRDSIVAGKLPDPRDPTVTWCVRETGTTTVTDIANSNGQQLRTRRYRFEGTFWLARVGGRYLIKDAEITNQPMPMGE